MPPEDQAFRDEIHSRAAVAENELAKRLAAFEAESGKRSDYLKTAYLPTVIVLLEGWRDRVVFDAISFDYSADLYKNLNAYLWWRRGQRGLNREDSAYLLNEAAEYCKAWCEYHLLGRQFYNYSEAAIRLAERLNPPPSPEPLTRCMARWSPESASAASLFARELAARVRAVGERAMRSSANENAYPSEGAFTLSRLQSMSGMTSKSLNKYAKQAGLPVPPRGGRNFVYSLSQTQSLLRQIIARSSDRQTVEKCNRALSEMGGNRK